MTNPPVWIILTTYNRKDVCLKTVRTLQENLVYDNYGWFICDDASSPPYVEEIKAEITKTSHIAVLNGERRGVGYMMNTALRTIWDWGVDLTLHMEDDWELMQPLNLLSYVHTLQNPLYSMIRFGYLSTNILGYTLGDNGNLYWRIENNEETYRFTGHPSLRHRRFHDKTLGGCGMYDEGLAPGMTELSMCGKVNLRSPEPANILYPCAAGQWGFFAHIGTEHMGAIEPEVK